MSNAKGGDTIDFNIAPAGAKTITLTKDLPDIDNTITIDGSTQPGYNGTPAIGINGNGVATVGLGVFALLL